MHHLRLIKGRSYRGAVTATKEQPDVYTENEKNYLLAMKSGYFKEIPIAEDASVEADAVVSMTQEENAETETKAEESRFADMKVDELKAYATVSGINISGLKKREEIVAAIEKAEKKAAEARAALRAE